MQKCVCPFAFPLTCLIDQQEPGNAQLVADQLLSLLWIPCKSTRKTHKLSFPQIESPTISSTERLLAHLTESKIPLYVWWKNSDVPKMPQFTMLFYFGHEINTKGYEIKAPLFYLDIEIIAELTYKSNIRWKTLKIWHRMMFDVWDFRKLLGCSRRHAASSLAFSVEVGHDDLQWCRPLLCCWPVVLVTGQWPVAEARGQQLVPSWPQIW